jgi:hypothetical protein
MFLGRGGTTLASVVTRATPARRNCGPLISVGPATTRRCGCTTRRATLFIGRQQRAAIDLSYPVPVTCASRLMPDKQEADAPLVAC